MILRKPYAILIKYFKFIHIVMFVFFAYLVFSLRKIYMFFSTYIKTSNFTYIENMSSIYVPWILFLIVILLLAFSIGIFLLMHKKEKPVLFYKIMIAYCVFLLIVFTYFIFFFKSLDNTVYEPLRIVANRDISLGAYILNFFFVAFTFIRGFGFDIKKFSFDKDKRELNLEESDSEEYELNVNIEKADVKSFLNKQKRELSYYFTENKKFFITVLIIAIISIGLYTYYSVFILNKVYKQGEDVIVGNIKYKVNNSLISDIDKYGQTIDTDNEYLIISINIAVRNGNKVLDGQALRVNIDNDYYYPTNTCDLFNDIGKCYLNEEIKDGTYNDYIFVYKIKKEHEKIFLEILKKSDDYQYSKVELLYEKEVITDIDKNLNDTITIDNNDIKITNFNFYEKTSYTYQECIEEKCNTFIKRIVPNLSESVLSLEIESNDLSDEFINSAIGIRDNNKIYTGNDIKLLGKNNNVLYYSVPSYLKTQDNVRLVINTRKTRYNILLKENNNE